MKQMLVWFFLSCKRQLKRLSFVLILLFLPLFCAFLHGVETDKNQCVNIAICALADAQAEDDAGNTGPAPVPDGEFVRDESNSSHSAATGKDLGAALVEALTVNQADDSVFHFYACGNEEAVREEVASRRAECGYVIEPDLRGKIQREEKRSVRVYCAPSTMLDRLTDEIVFADLARLYDREIFVQYMEKQGLAHGGADVGAFYDKWLDNNATFHFEYHYLDQNPDVRQTQEQKTTTLFPIRGIVAIMLFLTGIYSAAVLGLDEEKGLFLSLVSGERYVCRLAAVMAPVALASFSCLIALWFGGCIIGWGKEILWMSLYALAVSVYGLLLKSVLRSPRVIGCTIPFLLVASLTFCPVFLDIGSYLPIFRPLRWLLPPWYYLRSF